MTTQQTDIEKTLKRILARELPAWPEGKSELQQCSDGEVIGYGITLGVMSPAIDYRNAFVTRADWEAERALLTSEQAQPLGDSEAFDQALWDKVAIAAFAAHLPHTYSNEPDGEASRLRAFAFATFDADAFMAERAKRIAARKASHD